MSVVVEHGSRLLLISLICVLFCCPSLALINGSPNASQSDEPVRILALFSGAPNTDLGLDHRLGRQVLKLAASRARRLHPELSNVELLVLNDQAECSSASQQLPGQVAERFYSNHTADETQDGECNEQQECDQLEASRGLPSSSSVHAILGPSCEHLIDLVARMAAYWQTPIYTSASIGGIFARKDIYTTLTRLSPSLDHLSLFLVKVMERFKWRHLAVVVDSLETENDAILTNLDRTIRRMRYKIPIIKRTFTLNHSTVKMEQTNSLSGNYSACNYWKEAREQLEQVRRSARVVLLLLDQPAVVRRLLLCAHELQFNNGEFTFLVPNLGLKTSAGTSKSAQTFDWFVEGDEANNLRARQMFESLMIFSVELPLGDEFSYFIEQILELAHQEFPGARFERASVGPLAVALHESLLLAVEAELRARSNKRNLAIQSSATNSSASKRPALMWAERFTNGLVTSLHINAHGDQELDYVLSDLEPESGAMRPVAIYAKESRQVQLLPATYVHWPARLNAATRELLHNDEPPPDEPECGFTGEAERCVDQENLYVALSVASIFLLVISLVALTSLRRYRNIKYQMQLDDYWWKINWAELQFLHGPGKQVSMNSQCATSLARHLTRGHAQSLVSGSGLDNRNDYDQADGRSVVTAVSKRQMNNESRRSSGMTVPLIVTSGGASDQMGGAKSSLLELKSNVFRSELSTVVRQSSLALYRQELVIVKQLNGQTLEVTRELLVELKSMRELANENLARLVGLCLEPGRLALVYEFCSRGNLQDLLLNESLAIDWNLKCSIIGDIINGLHFIHTTLLDCHGRLKSTNLVLDSRFTVKLTDFGLKHLYNQLELIEQNDDHEEDDDDDEANRSTHDELATSERRVSQRRLSVTQTIYNMDSVSVRAAGGLKPRADCASLAGRHTSAGRGANRMEVKNRGSARFFWTAPELLRQRQPHLASSRRGDIYSLAIILYEILTRREPYYFGTNAKPRWRVIKRDKLRHQAAQQQQQQRESGKLAAALETGHGVAESVHLASGVSLVQHHQSRKSTGGSGADSQISSRWPVNPKRRSLASVAPSRELESGVSPSAAAAAAASDQVQINISQFDAGERHIIGDEVEEEAALGDHEENNSLVSLRADRPASSVISHGSSKPGSARLGERWRATDELEPALDADQILDQLRMGVQPEAVRPYIPSHLLAGVDPRLVVLLRSCWHETPNQRPSAGQVRSSLRKITRGATAKNYLDNLLDRLQTYAAQLERIVDGKSADLLAEKQRTEELLYQLVPKFVAEKLKRNEPIIPQVFDGVTIFFSDIVGFEKYASVMSPCELVDLLNNIYSSFESIISSFDVTKIEVILDQFLVAAGITLDQHEQEPEQHQQQAKSADCEGQQEAEVAETPAELKKPTKRRLLAGLRSQSKQRKQQSQQSQQSEDTDSSRRGRLTRQETLVKEASARALAKQQSFDTDHYKRSSAEQIARMALCIRDLVKSFNFRQNAGLTQDAGQRDSKADEQQKATPTAPTSNFVAASFNIRVGIHSGKVCAGIVGAKRPKFCLIGDTVNVASRMHTNSKANRIQISTDTRELLRQVPGLNIEPRGRIEVKGKGMMETYWLESAY